MTETLNARELEDGVVLRVEHKFVRRTGRLTLMTTPREVWVEVDGERQDVTTPTTLELPAGEVTLRVGAPQHAPEEVAGRVPPDGVGRMDVELAPYVAGDVFRDCAACPEMVVVPAGSFMMGSPESEEDRWNYEGPRHRVSIARPFAMGVHEVTFEEWDACVADGACGGHRPDDAGWGRESRPVMRVTWEAAQSYVAWLSAETGEEYRLPSEAEWEYAARAGTDTRYSWGDGIGSNRANCDGCGSEWDGERTAPVGSFPPNAWGLRDMHGNVYEWTEDCWHDYYRGAPSDGSAWLSGDCRVRVYRGGSWYDHSSYLRAAVRSGRSPGNRVNFVGFRVARTTN